MDVSAIESKISSNTKAIIVVHEFGFMCDISFIQQLANIHNIQVIKDAACAFGIILARQEGRYIWVYLGCFSHPRKILTTGEGGAIKNNDAEVAEKFRTICATMAWIILAMV